MQKIFMSLLKLKRELTDCEGHENLGFSSPLSDDEIP